ncbi:MAG: type II secretion system F family protein [Candidatus Peregrinibacteria bacterium]|nr:type II secretion system F family protein [Candidatus Peregrinibacteria bacterium]MDZ4244365.1 type II secretion system F family protein [Candidatus Gracilibacteria bacterium]
MKISLNKIYSYKYFLLICEFLIFILCMLIGIKFLFSFFIAVSPMAFIYIVQKFAEIKRKRRFSEQIPETVRAISNAMKAGYSFEQALSFVSRESISPIKGYLTETVRELEYNFSTEEVLNNLKNKANNSDINLVVDGILMQYKIGGNLIEMLENIADVTRERVKLQNDLKTFTAQGRFSGILVSMLFPLSLFMFSIISPEYVAPMYDTITGQFFLILAVLLEIIGFRLIWNITHIKL